MLSLTKIGLFFLSVSALLGLWWLFAVLSAVAAVSGGPWGNHPVLDFVIENGLTGVLVSAALGASLILLRKVSR